jgi:hypothetical protein
VNSFLSNALALIKGDIEIDGIPVLIGALQAFQKPNPLGLAGQAEAAELYLIGNGPAAMVAAEVTIVQQAVTDMSARLAALQAAASAAANPPVPAKP